MPYSFSGGKGGGGKCVYFPLPPLLPAGSVRHDGLLFQIVNRNVLGSTSGHFCRLCTGLEVVYALVGPPGDREGREFKRHIHVRGFQ